MAMTIDGLRLLQVVALRGSLSAAAADLGYTQSGVSRQLAVLENATGQRLVDRGAFGARLTPAGRRLLPHADAVIQAVSAAERAAIGETSTPAYRLGLFISAGATLLPRTLHALTDIGWDRTLRTIDGTSPMLIRAVLSGRLDGAVVVSRPPFRSLDDGSGRLHEHEIGVMELRVAVSQSHPLGHRMDLRIADLSAAAWADSASPGSDPVLGVWPGLDHRAEIRYRTTDWLTKLQLVAHGLAVTTVPPLLADALPRNTLMLEVTDVPPELRWVRLVTAVDRPAPDPSPICSRTRSRLSRQRRTSETAHEQDSATPRLNPHAQPVRLASTPTPRSFVIRVAEALRRQPEPVAGHPKRLIVNQAGEPSDLTVDSNVHGR